MSRKRCQLPLSNDLRLMSKVAKQVLARQAELAGRRNDFFGQSDLLADGHLVQTRKPDCLKIEQNEAVQNASSDCQNSLQVVKPVVSASIAVTSVCAGKVSLTQVYDSNILHPDVGDATRMVQEARWKEPKMEFTQTAPTISHETYAPPASIEDRRNAIQRTAAEVFVKHPDWATFFREIMGVDGIVRKMFRTPEEMAEFEKSAEHAEIQQMLAKLREKTAQSDDREPTRVITVRLPKSLHESLKTEAFERHTSMNQLCISKLLQVIGEGLVPAE